MPAARNAGVGARQTGGVSFPERMQALGVGDREEGVGGRGVVLAASVGEKLRSCTTVDLVSSPDVMSPSVSWRPLRCPGAPTALLAVTWSGLPPAGQLGQATGPIFSHGPPRGLWIGKSILFLIIIVQLYWNFYDNLIII